MRESRGDDKGGEDEVVAVVGSRAVGMMYGAGLGRDGDSMADVIASTETLFSIETFVSVACGFFFGTGPRTVGGVAGTSHVRSCRGADEIIWFIHEDRFPDGGDDAGRAGRGGSSVGSGFGGCCGEEVVEEGRESEDPGLDGSDGEDGVSEGDEEEEGGGGVLDMVSEMGSNPSSYTVNSSVDTLVLSPASLIISTFFLLIIYDHSSRLTILSLGVTSLSRLYRTRLAEYLDAAFDLLFSNICSSATHTFRSSTSSLFASSSSCFIVRNFRYPKGCLSCNCIGIPRGCTNRELINWVEQQTMLDTIA